MADIADRASYQSTSTCQTVGHGATASSDSSQLGDGGKFQFNNTIITKPEIDDREYKLLTLENGLEALIVSDPTTDRASACMDVNVGYLADPIEAPGLAHFLEHLLFLGTEKYPKENDYSQYVSDIGGGYTNAYTAVENTTYFFEVSAESPFLEGALDRIAQFFIAPLFNDSCTERELKAVDSEHKKNLLDDAWRLQHLDQHLCHPDHPYCKFGTGNWETLHDQPLKKGIAIREVLMDFHKTYYSANIMKLVVLGKESVDILAKWVVEKFAEVKNSNVARPTTDWHPLPQDRLQKCIFAKPIKEFQSLSLTFPFPDMYPHYKSAPCGYICHLIGHESEGSILSLLKSLGWAIDLSCWNGHGATNYGFFKISMSLTDSGLEHWKDIVLIIFQYIKLLKDNQVQKWIYEECQTMSMLSFKYQEKVAPSNFTSWVAQNMQLFKKEDILSGYYLMESYEPELIMQLIQTLRHDNFRITIVANAAPDEGFSGEWQTAPYYGTTYKICDIPIDYLTSLSELDLNPQLALPKPNPFIPNLFVVHPEIGQADAIPILIRETSTAKAWYKLDTKFKVPRTSSYFFLRTPEAYSSARTAVLTKLYTELVIDGLSEVAYLAEMGELYYGIESLTAGILVSFAGYSDKLGVLLQTVVEKMSRLVVDPDRFRFIKEELARTYKNFENENADHHANYYTTWTLQEILWTNAEKLAVLDHIQPEDVAGHVKNLLNPVHIEAFVHGTVTQEATLGFVGAIEREFATLRGGSLIPLPVVWRSRLFRYFQVPTNEELTSLAPRLAPQQSSSTTPNGVTIRRLLPNPDNVNNAVELYLHVGDSDNLELTTLCFVFNQLAMEPFFDQLRTKEQLGYTVWTGIRVALRSIGLRFVIQSERDPKYLEDRIGAFLIKFQQSIADMSNKEFGEHLSALHAKLLEKDKNQSAATQRMWSQIVSGSYAFRQSEEIAERISQVTKESVLNFYRRYVVSDSLHRRKLSVQVWSKTQWDKRHLPGNGDDGTNEKGNHDEGTIIGNSSVVLEGDEAVSRLRCELQLLPGPCSYLKFN